MFRNQISRVDCRLTLMRPQLVKGTNSPPDEGTSASVSHACPSNRDRNEARMNRVLN